ncbi:MAG: Gfo/Idh/MocA family oxidoreductase [Armatimonadetes bacterium]|nr:Gfo/Idh/MocA family oxidoreductase [Armatimonadota bacterium]
MKVVAIGAGKWGTNILNTLHETGNLAGIVELDESQHTTLQEKYDVPVAKTIRSLVPDSFQAVTIATPAPTHLGVGLEAIALGKHAFIEKPITLSAADAEELVKAADQAGVTLMTNHLLLYQPAIEFLGKSIREGLIGDLRSIHVTRANLGRARDVENVLWSLGVHDVAVVLDLVQDQPQDVTAVGDAFLNAGIEDDTHLHITFENGVKAHIHNSWLWPVLDRRTIVIGSKGMLWYDELNQTVTLHKKSINASLQNVNDGEEVVFEGAAKPLTLSLEHFIDCATNGKTPRSDGASARTVIGILEDASRSLK